MAEVLHLVAASIVYKRKGEDISWFLVKENEETGWEIPKTIAKNGESSVRASIRSLSEQAGMRVKVQEEVGRHGGAAKHAGKIVTQRTIYYLITHKEGEQILGFVETGWFEYTAALRKLNSKLDREMLKEGKTMLLEILAKKKKKKKALSASEGQ